MSKMNGKKENLEKKGAMNEIKENEMGKCFWRRSRCRSKWFLCSLC